METKEEKLTEISTEDQKTLYVNRMRHSLLESLKLSGNYSELKWVTVQCSTTQIEDEEDKHYDIDLTFDDSGKFEEFWKSLDLGKWICNDNLATVSLIYFDGTQKYGVATTYCPNKILQKSWLIE